MCLACCNMCGRAAGSSGCSQWVCLRFGLPAELPSVAAVPGGSQPLRQRHPCRMALGVRPQQHAGAALPPGWFTSCWCLANTVMSRLTRAARTAPDVGALSRGCATAWSSRARGAGRPCG